MDRASRSAETDGKAAVGPDEQAHAVPGLPTVRQDALLGEPFDERSAPDFRCQEMRRPSPEVGCRRDEIAAACQPAVEIVTSKTPASAEEAVRAGDAWQQLDRVLVEVGILHAGRFQDVLAHPVWKRPAGGTSDHFGQEEIAAVGVAEPIAGQKIQRPLARQDTQSLGRRPHVGWLPAA
jgi:hypothetical protein